MRRQIFSVILFLILVVGIVVFSFTFYDAKREEEELTVDLERRSLLLSESLRESIEPQAIAGDKGKLQGIVDRFSGKERLMGLMVYDNKDNILAVSSTIPTTIPGVKDVVMAAMDEDSRQAEFTYTESNDKRYHLYAVPLRNDGSVIGAFILFQNAAYIDTALGNIWGSGILRFFSYSIILTSVFFILAYWMLSRPLGLIMEKIKKMRNGSQDFLLDDIPGHAIFSPIIDEISVIQKSLSNATNSASYEARLRQEELESPWTAERLKEYTKDALKDRTLYVVSNREPYIHIKKGNTISVVEPASGMVTALDPIMKACGGVWIAHGSGNADREVVDVNDKVEVPPSDPKYFLKRVFLTEKEEQGYYYGFANDGLWPLSHSAFVEPQFRKSDFEEYKKVNEKFAASILSEIKDVEKPLIFIQDYHFTLLPQLIKNSRPDAVIALFWHIPWPSAESFRICPWGKEILEGMLGADMLAFHTQLQCNNFIETVRKEVEALVDLEQFTIQKNRHLSLVKPIPISVEFRDSFAGEEIKMSSEKRDKILREYGVKPTEFIGVGVDRMDYTKGLVERFLAIERFFEKNPTYKGKFTFFQIAPSTRLTIPSYKRLAIEVKEQLERINNKYKERGWVPIIMYNKHLDRKTIGDIYRVGNICMVTSLHDGMNLVAKEFVAERRDGRGVLILSEFTGASQDLKQALIINPYDIDGTADAIKKGLEMPLVEQKRRMEILRKTVRTNNIYRWAALVLKAMMRIDL